MDLILDFQGFKDNTNQFIIKELALVSRDGTFVQHWIVKSTFKYLELDLQRQKSAYWNTKYFHGLTWNSGDVTIQDLHYLLADILKDSCVFIKGKEKADYIQEHFPNCYVFDLEYYPSLKTLTEPKVRCFYHRDSYFCCALSNVFKLLKFYTGE